MNNLIAAANGKLDDPVMREWAVHFYSDLPKHAHDERVRIETDWFHEFFIAQLIDRGETILLTRLFRVLPPEHFSNLKSLILKNWSAWPTSTINSAASVLVAIAPDDLLHLYETDLKSFKQGTNVDLLRFSSIDLLLEKSNEIACVEFVNQLVKTVITCPDDLRKSLLIPSLLTGAQHLSWDVLEPLIDAALDAEKIEYRRENIYASLFIGLFGDDEFLTMMLCRGEYESPLRLAALQPLFVQNAPLEKLDDWLQALPQFEDTLEVIENIAKESLGCQTMLRVLMNSSSTSRLSSKTKTQLSIAACLHGFAKSSLDTTEFELSTTIDLLAADLPDSRWSPFLIEHLRSFDRQLVVPALTSRISTDFNSFGAAQIAIAMGELGDTAFIAPLIAALDDDRGDFLCEAAQESITEFGDSAQAALISQWDQLDRSQQIYGLSVISNVHGKAAADFAVARFSKLMADDLEHVCELILASPDSRLLNLLKPELRRKQSLIDRACYICARLMDYDGPEIEQAKERALADFKRCENLFESIESSDFLSQPQLFVELECPLCKAVNKYEAKGVVISDDPDAAFLLNDEFPCASCGQEVEFGFTPMSRMALGVGFLGSQVNAKEGRQQNDHFKRINYKVDGRVMPLATGLAMIRNHLTAKPSDALGWYRLGNLLSFLNRPKETAAAYRKALNIKPNAIDATFALATILAESQQETEALELLQEAIERIPSWIFLLPFPNFSHDFVDLYNALIRTLRRNELPVLHPSALASSKKIGRNDSCPCGSGKKFKKCCGR